MERKTRFELATPSLARRCSTTELFPQLATRMGLEPTTSAVTGRHSNQLNHRANCQTMCLTVIYNSIDFLIWQVLFCMKIFTCLSNRKIYLSCISTSMCPHPSKGLPLRCYFFCLASRSARKMARRSLSDRPVLGTLGLSCTYFTLAASRQMKRTGRLLAPGGDQIKR